MATNSKSSIQSNQKIRNIFAWNKQQWIIIIVTSLILLIWYYSSGTDNFTPWLTNDNVPQNDRTNLQQIDHLERSSPIIMSHHQMISMPIDVDDHELSNLNHTLHENEIVHTIHNGTQGQVQDTILQQHHQQQQHRRVKRGVLDLASMIRCITGCNPFSYKDYGCYCGFQGDGYPVDGIDRCCYMHDNCYEQTDCHPALVYFKSYKWSCMGYGRAKCSYRSSSSMCGFQLCECDRKFAKCLSRYRCPNSKASCDITKHIIIGK